VAALFELGFHLNEARAYAELLRAGPSTGYEVSRRAAVPRSAVYGVLRRLTDRGAARAIAGSPERFVATPVTALLAQLRRRFDGSATHLRDAATQLEATPSAPDAFSVRGYQRILEEAARVVLAAREVLVLSGWPRELAELKAALAAVSKRGVYTVLFSHAALADDLAGVHFSYGLTEPELEAFWKHRLVVVADDRSSLIAATEGRPNDTAVISETPAIAEVAVGQIALDVTLLAQRHHRDVSAVMARLLGDRVGRLDTLLSGGAVARVGTLVGNGAGKRTTRS
jgi:sugar-specific transcriptional regulator TrmB